MDRRYVLQITVTSSLMIKLKKWYYLSFDGVPQGKSWVQNLVNEIKQKYPLNQILDSRLTKIISFVS